MPRLYDPTDVATLAWPDTALADTLRRYWLPFMERGSRALIANVETRPFLLAVDDLVLPVTVNEAEFDDSFVSSLYTQNVTIAREEVHRLDSAALRAVARGFFDHVAPVLRRTGVNRIVSVNNWLLSTNLYPAISAAQLDAITKLLCERFPDHAIQFRTVDDPSPLARDLADRGYRSLVSRRVHWYDPELRPFFPKRRRKKLRREARRLQENGYEVVEHDAIPASEAPRLAELYNLVYIDRHSRLNPIYTEEFLRTALVRGGLQLSALRREGRIDGFIAEYTVEGVRTGPLLGHDTSLPRKRYVYPMLYALSVEHAGHSGVRVNFSSGVDEFKRMRGCLPGIQSSFFYHRHLPAQRRIPRDAVIAAYDPILRRAINAPRS